MMATAAPATSGPGRRVLRRVGWTLIWFGVLTGAFLVYQLWGTTVYYTRAQESLETDLDRRFAEVVAPTTTASSSVSDTQDPTTTTSTTSFATPIVAEPPPQNGLPFGRIVIPSAEVDAILLSGVDRDTLKQGPGHMPSTPLPGQLGNAVVSGHRTTYGAPFYWLDRTEVGDEIRVETGIGEHAYVVREVLVVEPTDVWVTEERIGAWLTITTCTPRFSAAQRLVVVAELERGPNAAAALQVPAIAGPDR